MKSSFPYLVLGVLFLAGIWLVNQQRQYIRSRQVSTPDLPVFTVYKVGYAPGEAGQPAKHGPAGKQSSTKSSQRPSDKKLGASGHPFGDVYTKLP